MSTVTTAPAPTTTATTTTVTTTTVTTTAAADLASIDCPECAGQVACEPGLMLHELLPCGACGAELEVIALDPIAVELAPEIEEDWGE